MNTQFKVDYVFKNHKLDYDYDDTRHTEDFPDDCQRIIQVVKKQREVDLTPLQASIMWSWYSEEYLCAGWLIIGSDREIIEAFDHLIDDYFWQLYRYAHPEMMNLK